MNGGDSVSRPSSASATDGWTGWKISETTGPKSLRVVVAERHVGKATGFKSWFTAVTERYIIEAP